MCVQASHEFVERITKDAKAAGEEGSSPWVEYGLREVKGKGQMKTFLAEIGEWEKAMAAKKDEGTRKSSMEVRNSQIQTLNETYQVSLAEKLESNLPRSERDRTHVEARTTPPQLAAPDRGSD